MFSSGTTSVSAGQFPSSTLRPTSTESSTFLQTSSQFTLSSPQSNPISLSRPTNTSSVSSTSHNPTSTITPTSLSTLDSLVSLTVTNPTNGKTTIEIPTLVTRVYASTNQDGCLITVTNVAVNPTGMLSPGTNTPASSRFFNNPGAVAGVFLVAGIAVTSTLLFFLFSLRRHHKNRRRQSLRAEQDMPVRRTPFEDDQAAGNNADALESTGEGSEPDFPQIEMSQRPLSPNNNHFNLHPITPQQRSWSSLGGHHHSTESAYPSTPHPDTPQPWSSLGPHLHSTTDLAKPMPFGARAPSINDSSATIDHVLDPSHPEIEFNPHGSQLSFVHDDVDYSRRIWSNQGARFNAI